MLGLKITVYPLSIEAEKQTFEDMQSYIVDPRFMLLFHAWVFFFYFYIPFLFRNVEPHDFDNVEDMLFEVFRCEETDTIDSISIAQFIKVSTLTHFMKNNPSF